MAKGGPNKRKEEGIVNELGAVSLNEGDGDVLSSDEDEIEDEMVGDRRKKKIIISPKRRRGSNEAIGSSGKIVDAPPLNVNLYHKNRRRRVLVVSSRSITSRFRHLMEDLRKLLPHHKKDVKLNLGKDSLVSVMNTIAELKSCENVIFFDCRKKSDLYLWIGSTPDGPCVKFHAMNVHTMEELKFTGNAMLGSRPLLSFDSQFETSAHWKLIKSLFSNVFSTSKGHPKGKPFVDRIMSFYVADNCIWIRNYQIVHPKDKKDTSEASLVEIGPRFVLKLIRIFEGSFGGPTLFQNPTYVSPNSIRAGLKRKAGRKYANQVEAKSHNREKKMAIATPRDPVDDVFLPPT
eukprot:30253_1